MATTGSWSAPLDLQSELVYRLYQNTSVSTIHGVLTFANPLPLEKVHEGIVTRLLPLFRYFRCIIVKKGLRYHWQEVKVDLSKIVVEKKLSGNPDDALEAYIGDILPLQFDVNLPQWEVHVISYKESRRQDILWRINHALGDGTTLAGVLLNTTDSAPKPTGSDAKEKEKEKEKQKEEESKASKSHRQRRREHCLRRSWELFTYTLLVIFAYIKVVNLPYLPADSVSAIRPNTERSQKKLFAKSRWLSVQEAKVAGKRIGATINDLLMAALGATVREYLKLKQDPLLETEGGCLGGLRVRGLGIVNMRAVRGGDSREKLMEDYGRGKCNDWSYLFVPMPVHEATPLERVKSMQRSLAILKRSPEAMFFSVLNRVFIRLMGMRFMVWFNNFVTRKLSMLISNLPGPQEQLLAVNGEPLVDLYNCVNPGLFGIAASFLSYNGHITLCVAVDSLVFPTPRQFIDIFHREYQAILDATKSA